MHLVSEIVEAFVFFPLLIVLAAAIGAAQPPSAIAGSPVCGFASWEGLRSGSSLSVGKWLLLENGEPAHWLGRKHQGRSLLEPINVIVYDPFAASAEEAEDKLIGASRRGGYAKRLGHSAAYCGYIESARYGQIAARLPAAFADRSCFRANNHGRLIGPSLWNGGFVFIGAFSRERFRLLPTVAHLFLSFGEARDDFCTRLASSGLYAIAGRIDLGNSLDMEQATTADHDGMAIVLEARR